jgi:hypothetical protein
MQYRHYQEPQPQLISGSLAEQLERDAALRERQLQKDVSDRPRDRQEPGRPLTEITNTEA